MLNSGAVESILLALYCECKARTGFEETFEAGTILLTQNERGNCALLVLGRSVSVEHLQPTRFVINFSSRHLVPNFHYSTRFQTFIDISARKESAQSKSSSARHLRRGKK